MGRLLFGVLHDADGLLLGWFVRVECGLGRWKEHDENGWNVGAVALLISITFNSPLSRTAYTSTV
jgi:hypothetical protein